MKRSKIWRLFSLTAVIAIGTSMMFGSHVSAADGGGLILLSQTSYLWTDPGSGGQIQITERVYEGCDPPGPDFHPHHMTWSYSVYNISYDPIPGITNGLSGFQIVFPLQIAEVHNQQSPLVGGPWVQNTFSGISPPWGVEWDAPLPGTGIMPGQTGIFSYCTFERERVVKAAPDAGWAHTWGIPEPIIDLDGTATAGVGVAADRQVVIGSPLTNWPSPGLDAEGIDWFDNDWNGISPRTWTPGDGIHVEGPAYPAAIRNAVHDATDPVVVGIAVVGDQVDVDLESNIDFFGGSGVDPRMKFYNANAVTNWDDGEDIVLDTNLDGVFGLNAQTSVFYGRNSVPGLRLGELGVAESAGHEIFKVVKFGDADRDRLIEVGELVHFMMVIQVHNPTGSTWTNVVVTDHFGAELGVSVPAIGAPNPTQGTPFLTTQGKSDKVFLEWNVGTIPAGGTASLVLSVVTDQNPGGQQEYTAVGVHEFNSGAVLKYRDSQNKQKSASTGPITLEVVWDLVDDWQLVYTGLVPPSGPYVHNMSITTEKWDGTFSGTGAYANPPPAYTWGVTGDVTGNNVSMVITYDQPVGATFPYVVTLTGTVAAGGASMSGTASDNQGNTYTWTATRVP